MENSHPNIGANYDQFQHIQDMIGGQGNHPIETSGALSKEVLFRQLASEHLLKQIGVDIDKFMSQKMSDNNLAPKPQALGKLMGVSLPEFSDEEEPVSGLPNPLSMPSIGQLKGGPQ